MGYRDYATAKAHIVDANGHGDFTTISAALTAATSGQTIFIMPGTYTENPMLKAGVNLVAYNADAFTPNVIIVGKATLSTAGTVSASGIRFKTNSDFCISVTGSAASILQLINCNIEASNNTAINFTSSNSSSIVSIDTCALSIDTTGISIYSMSSVGLLSMINCYSSNSGSTTSSSNSAGSVQIFHSNIVFPISTSSTGITTLTNTNGNSGNTTFLTTAGSGINTILNSNMASGTASTISIGAGTTVLMALCAVTSSNTNAITGSGILNAGIITFTGASSTINTTTVNKLTTFGGTIV